MSESFKHDIREADFRMFLLLWNQTQNLRTPDIHKRMALWMERAWKTGRKELLLMAFRSSGKSTMAGLFCAWLLYRKPELRILVLAADDALAGKMVRNVKRIIERHPLTGKMKPDRADQWASDRFTVRRSMELRDPSMLARGITSNLTGSRADVVICDDVEVPNTCDTAEKRAELRERLGEISFILVPGGTQMYIGTPHNYYTIYADAPRVEIGETKSFLHGFHALKIPVLNDAGESSWIERFSEADIAIMKDRAGPNKFSSQMMLRPANIAEGRLDPRRLNLYSDQADYAPELGTMFIGSRRMVSAHAYWDPSFGTAKGDRSVLACVFGDDEGNLYLHDLVYIAPSVEGGEDEASAQCRIVAGILKRHMIPNVAVETNGIGKFLPAILRNILAREKVPASVSEINNSQPKHVRILESFDAPLAARRLYVHERVMKTPFAAEMQEWRPGATRGHDDGLDASAGAISLHPLRLKRLYGKGAYEWMSGAKPSKARTDFTL